MYTVLCTVLQMRVVCTIIESVLFFLRITCMLKTVCVANFLPACAADLIFQSIMFVYVCVCVRVCMYVCMCAGMQ